jgi:P27 family predicted phage terminase small subunit
MPGALGFRVLLRHFEVKFMHYRCIKAHAPVRPSLLTGTDRAIFSVWPVACVEYARAAQEVRNLGQVVKTKEGNVIQNPYLSIMNRQAAIMLKAGGELGFTPAARASLGSIAPEFNDVPGYRTKRVKSELDEYIAAKPDKLDS